MELSISNIKLEINALFKKKKKTIFNENPSFAKIPPKERNKAVTYIICGGSFTKLN